MGGSGSGHTEIFIGPNIQRVAAGGLRGGGGGGGGGSDAMGGRGTAGVEGLESLGFLLRGMGMVALGGGGGNIGNVGDYAFGDLSNLIQQLMAADPNRVSDNEIFFFCVFFRCPVVLCRRYSGFMQPVQFNGQQMAFGG